MSNCNSSRKSRRRRRKKSQSKKREKENYHWGGDREGEKHAHAQPLEMSDHQLQGSPADGGCLQLQSPSFIVSMPPSPADLAWLIIQCQLILHLCHHFSTLQFQIWSLLYKNNLFLFSFSSFWWLGSGHYYCTATISQLLSVFYYYLISGRFGLWKIQAFIFIVIPA